MFVWNIHIMITGKHFDYKDMSIWCFEEEKNLISD